MFNNDDQVRPVPTRLALSDGRTLDGNLMLPASANIKRILSSDGAVLEFENHAGVASLVAKSAIVEIIPVVAGKPQTPGTPETDDALDSHAILGIATSATPEQTRTAFDGLKMQYHPDRFAGMSLPDEVLAFIGVRVKQIDAAYALIGNRVVGT